MNGRASALPFFGGPSESVKNSTCFSRNACYLKFMKHVLLIPPLLLAGCVASDPDLVNKYLTEANAGLPRETFPVTVERVEQRGYSLVTLIYVNANKITADQRDEAMSGAMAATHNEVIEICKSPYYTTLRNQGYDFKLNLAGVKAKDTLQKEWLIEPSSCQSARS